MFKKEKISEDSVKIFKSALVESVYKSRENLLNENEEKDPFIECDDLVMKCTSALNQLQAHLLTMPSSKSSAVAQKIKEMYAFVHKITPSNTKLADEATTSEKQGVKETITESIQADKPLTSFVLYLKNNFNLQALKVQRYKHVNGQHYIKAIIEIDPNHMERGEGEVKASHNWTAIATPKTEIDGTFKLNNLGMNDYGEVNLDSAKEIFTKRYSQSVKKEDINVSAKADSQAVDTAFDNAKKHKMNITFTESKYPNLKEVLNRYNKKYNRKMTSEELFEHGRYMRNEKKDEGRFLSEYGNFLVNSQGKKQNLSEDVYSTLDLTELSKECRTFEDYKKGITEMLGSGVVSESYKIIKEMKISDLNISK